MENKTTLVFGPPGCGKTTFVLNIVDEALAKGVPPYKIGFFSFTQKAAWEARDRALVKFKMKSSALPFFRTLHSLAFRQLALQRDSVFNWKHLRQFAGAMNMDLTFNRDREEGTFGMTKDDKLMHYEGLSRIMMIPLEEIYKTTRDLNWYELERVARGLKHYKGSEGLLDFHDMILHTLDPAVPMPRFDLLIVDEAQDLSLSQWRLVERLIENSEKVYIAGDDDQAIFKWAGADVDHFINIKGNVVVLDQSYRVPKKIQALANDTVGKIQNRKNKQWRSTKEEGIVEFHTRFEHLAFGEGQWLALARNKYTLLELVDYLRREGLFFEFNGEPSITEDLMELVLGYVSLQKDRSISKELALKIVSNTSSNCNVFQTNINKLETVSLKHFNADFQSFLKNRQWFDALNKIPYDQRAYIVSMKRRGEQITKVPRIKLSTIHGAKGGEAEKVLLFTDISQSSHEEYRRNPDDENRVLYVGQTRAKEQLHIMQPKTDFYFDV